MQYPNGFVPRAHQVKAADAIFEAWARGVKRPVVDMCVGSGKSYTMGIVAARAHERAIRSVILADRRELVKQNAAAVIKLGTPCGINAEALKQRVWRAPAISASIHSTFRNAAQLGTVGIIMPDECHMVPHGQAGMYRQFFRAHPNALQAGFSGTIFRLNGGSLIEGEDAPFEECVYTYSILDGINDGFLVPAFSANAVDKIDPNLLRKAAGEFSASSQDAQTIELIENHIAQLKIIGANRRAWLIFEASQKSAYLMTEALNRHGISARCITDQTAAADRENWIADFQAGRLRALVNIQALTTGFDAQITDMLVMRRRTASLGLYIQMIGRLLRTINGNIRDSILAGKSDGIVVDFAGNIDQHGPLDFLRPKETTVKMVSCEPCGARNVSSAVYCWSCDAKMTKVCPACMADIEKGLTKCPECEADLTIGKIEGEEPKPRSANLLEMPSGAALIQAFRPIAAKQGGWIPIRKAFRVNDISTVLDANGDSWVLSEALAQHVDKARWVRPGEGGTAAFLLKPNGASRSNAVMVTPAGVSMPVPMPPTREGELEQ